VKKSAKEISGEDGLQKQMDWENKLLGPNTEKKIDLAKIQKLQAEEAARREKQDKIDKVDKERKDREAAIAAQRRDVKEPSTRDVPTIEEAPPPPKPAEKHDDAFVDKIMKDGKSGEKKHAVSNDEVDQLLAKAKQDKAANIAPKSNKNGRTDSVDQLLATSDKQQSIKTTTKKPVEAEPVSAEAAAREATLKAVATAQAKAQDERNRNKRPAIPDAAMLRAQQPTPTAVLPPQPKDTGKSGSWSDPFANEATPSRRSKVVPASSRSGAAAGRHAPSSRPAANDGWQDPFDSGGGNSKARPSAPKSSPGKGKHPAHWKDPFA